MPRTLAPGYTPDEYERAVMAAHKAYKEGDLNHDDLRAVLGELRRRFNRVPG